MNLFYNIDINRILNNIPHQINDYNPPQFYNYTHITITFNNRYWERNVFRKRFRSRRDSHIKRHDD